MSCFILRGTLGTGFFNAPVWWTVLILGYNPADLVYDLVFIPRLDSNLSLLNEQLAIADISIQTYAFYYYLSLGDDLWRRLYSKRDWEWPLFTAEF
jgi:hypothetical protein